MGKILTSEFHFGFELEAYVQESLLSKYGYTPSKSKSILIKDMYNEKALYNDLSKWLETIFNTKCKIVEDGSLNKNKMVGGFEFPTPILDMNPKTILKCIKFLDEMRRHPKYKIYTTSLCGFHIHMSFPNMNNEDMAWIIAQIAMNDEYISLLTSFKDFNFYNDHYASKKFLIDLREAIVNNETSDINYLISNYKYRVLRLHPQGTLEWRGPRDFLNEGNRQEIKDFFIQLYKICKMISDIMDMKTIGNYTKKDFLKIVDISAIQYRSSKDLPATLCKRVYHNPEILLKLNDCRYVGELVKKIYYYYGLRLDNKIATWLKPLRNKFFNNTLLLANIIHFNYDFLNYVVNPLEKILFELNEIDQNLFMEKISSCSALSPEMLKIIIKHMDISIYFLMRSIVNFEANNPNSVNPFTDKEVLNIFAEKYGLKNLLSRVRESTKISKKTSEKIISYLTTLQ